MRRFNFTSFVRIGKTTKIVCLAATICLITVPTFACSSTVDPQKQDGGPPAKPKGEDKEKGPGGRSKGRGGHRERQRHDDAFFSALREVHKRFGSTRELIMMIRHPEIQAEIQLNPEGYKQLTDHVDQIFDRMSDVRKKMGEEQITDFEKVAERVMQVAEKHNDELNSILNKVVGNSERMLGLYVQASGARAAMNELVAQKIGIGEDELKRLLEERDELWQRTMKARFKQIGQLIRADKRSQMQELIATSEKEFKEQLSKMLTKDQRKKLNALKGEAFDLPPNLFGMPRRSGRGGGPDKNPPRPDGQRPPKPCV